MFGLTFDLKAQFYKLSGSLEDNSGEPIPYATVMIKNKLDSSMIKAELSRDNGIFLFNQITKGRYFLETSFLGMKDFISGEIAVTDNVFLEPIVLEATSMELDEIVVKSYKPLVEVKADKTVFNVSNTINAAGNNGLELLRKAPGIILDNNNNIIVEGKTGVQIYLDGKPSVLSGEDLTAFLESLQSSDIESLEIVTQPSSRYDAAGNAGIINIKLVKDKGLGTNGSLTLGSQYGKNFRGNAALSINIRTKKSNLYGNYSNSLGKSWDYINLYRTQNNVIYDAKTENFNDQFTQNFRLGLDLFATPNSTIGVMINGNLYENETDGNTITPIIYPNMIRENELLVAGNITSSNNKTLTFNSNYRYADKNERELSIDFDYGYYNRKRNNYQPNTYSIGEEIISSRNFRMVTPIDIDIVSAKIDYNQPFLSGVMDIGGKISMVDTKNSFSFYNIENEVDIFNIQRSNNFQYSERITAGYFQYSRQWEKLQIQFGLRAENTISEGILSANTSGENDQVNRNYLDVFPSGGLTYKAKPNSTWALQYSRRISRPNYQSLNPFEYQLDELSLSKGNPFLQPQYTNNVKLAHTHNYRLTTSVSYSYVSDFFASVTDTLGNNKNFLQTRNVANQKIWSAGLSYPFGIRKWWNVYLSINGYHSSYLASNEKFTPLSRTSLSGYIQNTITLPGDWRAEISGWFSSPSVWGGTYRTESMGSLDLAIQRKLSGGKWVFRFAASDILFTSPWKGSMQFGQLFIDGTGGWEFLPQCWLAWPG